VPKRSTESKQSLAEGGLVEALAGFMETYKDVLGCPRSDYDDSYHKQVTSKIAALNGMQNSAGKLIVSEAVFNKVEIKALPGS